MVQKKIKKFYNSVTINERMPVLYKKPKPRFRLFAAGIFAAALCSCLIIGLRMSHEKSKE